MDVLVTGVNGFIGRALCSRLASDNKVVGVDITAPLDEALNIAWERADPPASPERERPARLALRSIAGRWRAGLTDRALVAAICKKYSPDVVIHCAGIAHQKMGAVESSTYMRVNSEATDCVERM